MKLILMLSLIFSFGGGVESFASCKAEPKKFFDDPAKADGIVTFVDANGNFKLDSFSELLFLTDVKPAHANDFSVVKGWKLRCSINDFIQGDLTPPYGVNCYSNQSKKYNLSETLTKRKLTTPRK